MFIYLIYLSEKSLSHHSWDFYDSAVVVAASEEAARRIHPVSVRDNIDVSWEEGQWWLTLEDGSFDEYGSYDWATPEGVEVRRIGTADAGIKPSVIMASFNAG
jgi:hypothetical protein